MDAVFMSSMTSANEAPVVMSSIQNLHLGNSIRMQDPDKHKHFLSSRDMGRETERLAVFLQIVNLQAEPIVKFCISIPA